jgi:hypothetical protein
LGINIMISDKWLSGVVCTVSFVAACSMYWGEVREAAAQAHFGQSCVRTGPAATKPSCCALAESPSAKAVSDAAIKAYYLDHIWEFEPLPPSPVERVKVWRNIEASIRTRLSFS